MALLKNPKADLRRQYSRIFEVSLILSLAFLIIAFKFFPDVTAKKMKVEGPQELFTVEDIQHTKQENRPPPPPKPPIPIEAPSDDVLEDVEIGSTELQVDEVEKLRDTEVTQVALDGHRALLCVAVEEMP